MICQILFSGKSKKKISKCRLLKILPRVLSVKRCSNTLGKYGNKFWPCCLFCHKDIIVM